MPALLPLKKGNKMPLRHASSGKEHIASYTVNDRSEAKLAFG
jgi:hypothetical protein